MTESASDFIASLDLDQRLETECIAVAMELDGETVSPERHTSLSRGKTRWIVVRETELTEGDEVVATLRPGTVVEAATETADGPRVRITWKPDADAAPLEGWVPTENLKCSDR